MIMSLFILFYPFYPRGYPPGLRLVRPEVSLWNYLIRP